MYGTFQLRNPFLDRRDAMVHYAHNVILELLPRHLGRRFAFALVAAHHSDPFGCLAGVGPTGSAESRGKIAPCVNCLTRACPYAQ
jgi:hypothetical protein